MRFHFAIFCPAMLSVVLCGCDSQAQKFAAETLRILEHRSAELSKKTAAEKAAYARSAALAAEDQRALIASSLQNERNERSTALAADYDEGRRPVSQWQKDLSEYGRIDYDLNMEMYAADVDLSTQYLQVFDSLKIEAEKVDALEKLFGALVKKQSLKTDVQALAKFGGDTDDEFDKKVCAEIARQQASTDAKVKAAADAAFKAQGCKKQ